MVRKRHTDGDPEDVAGDPPPLGASPRGPSQTTARDPSREIDARVPRDDSALRPRSFAEYVGQRKVVDNLKIFVAAAARRGERLDHVLFSGPPGIGKTTL